MYSYGAEEGITHFLTVFPGFLHLTNKFTLLLLVLVSILPYFTTDFNVLNLKSCEVIELRIRYNEHNRARGLQNEPFKCISCFQR